MSGESPLPGLQTVAFLLCPHMAEKEREQALDSFSFYKDTNHIMGNLPS